MEPMLERRRFLKGLGVSIVSGVAGTPLLHGAEGASTLPSDRVTLEDLPKRKLGRIGIDVAPLSFGTAAMGHAFYEAEPFEQVINAAIDSGVRYIDVAPIYDVAETRLKPILAKRRKEIFLVTKAVKPTRDEVLRSLETSFTSMGVEEADLCHIHNAGLWPPEEVIGKGGALEGMLEARKRGWTRYIGCSGHMRVDRFAPLIETDEIDLVMLAMNFVDVHTYNFEERVLPVARKHNCAIVCMKVYGGVTGQAWGGYRERNPGRLAQDEATRQAAVDYALSIPGVSTCVVGIKSLEELRLSIKAFRNHRPLDDPRRQALAARGAELARQWGPRFGPVDESSATQE